LDADVAQLVEQRIRNAKVVSSIPIIGTKNTSKGFHGRATNKDNLLKTGGFFTPTIFQSVAWNSSERANP
jgi:hypothetical protein